MKLFDSGLISPKPQALKSLNQNFQLNEIEGQFWRDDQWLPYLKARNSMPDEDSVITLLGHVSMNKRAYKRKVPHLDKDERLFRNSSHGKNS